MSLKKFLHGSIKEFKNQEKSDALKNISIRRNPENVRGSIEVSMSYQHESMGMPYLDEGLTTTDRLHGLIEDRHAFGEFHIRDTESFYDGTFLKLDKLKSFLEEVEKSNLVKGKSSFIDDVMSHVADLSTEKSYVASLAKQSSGSKERLH